MSEVTQARQEEHLVIFTLADECYALDISTVQEIILWQSVTRVPMTPDVEGIINLRGNVIPVIDLRKRFGLEAQTGPETRIVVVEIGAVVAGLVVDGVHEVLRVPVEQIVPAPPTVMTAVSNELIRGIAKTEERLIILLVADRILAQL